MTPFEKAVEAGAMAIQQTDYSNVGVSPWDHMPERSKAMFKSESRAALTAALSTLKSEGWVLVPTKATPQMCEAMYELQREQETLAVLVLEAYRAMLSSRPKMEDGNG